jgi:hypothetical protein
MNADFPEPPVYPEELERAIHVTLAELAAIDHDFDDRLAALDARSLSQGQRSRLRRRLDAEHKTQREPLVLHLANLHYRMVRATMFGSLAKPVPSVSALRAFRV